MKQKFFLLKAFFLLCALVVGSPSVLADETVIFDFQQNTNDYGSDVTPAASTDLAVGTTFTNGYSTFKYDAKGSGTTNLRWWSTSDGLRSYKGNRFTIASTAGEIKSITIDGTCVLVETSSTGGTISNSRNWTKPDAGGISSVSFECNQSSGAKTIKKITISLGASDAPSATLDKTSLDFGKVNFGETKSLTFTVTPANLTGDLAISCNNATKYEVTPTSIAKATTTAQAITVTAKPTAIDDDMDGTITISGGGLASSKTVTLSTTVTDPNANDGSEEHPYTVVEACAAIDAGTGITGVYARGIISEVSSYNSTYHSITYWISDNGTSNQLQVYSGKGLNGANFTSKEDLKVGDIVVVCGNLKKYNSTYEFEQNNQLASLVRNHTLSFDTMTNGDVTVKVNDVDAIPDGEGDYSIAEGASVTVTAVPESGYNFVLWSSTHDAEDGSTTNPLTFNMPTEDVLMGATFANPTQEYDILVDDAIVGGSVSVAGDLTKATAGTEITLTATPAENYVFDAWAVEDENSNPITVTENKFTMPAAGVIVSATFNRQYTITYYINGVKQTPVKRIVGTPINIEGLTSGFAGWSTNSSVAEVEYTNSSLVSNDMTLYAVFVASIGTPSYKLVEADQADWRGKYLIAYSDDIFADGRVGKTPTTSPGIGASGVSVDPNSKLTGKEVDATWGDLYNLTIEAIDDADLSMGYVMKAKDNYYVYQTENANGILGTANKSTASIHPLSITFNSPSDIAIANAVGAVFHYNESGYFRYYKNGTQKAVYLYKRTAPTTYGFDETEVVNVTDANWATYVTEDNIDFANSTGIKAYKAISTTADGIKLEEITEAPKGTAVVIAADEAGYVLTEAASTPAAVTGNILQVSDGTITGDYNSDTKESTYYVLGKNTSEEVGFGPLAKGVKLAKGKAYIHKNDWDTATAKDFLPFIINEESETTSINSIENSELRIENYDYFNLSGQRVGKDYKGIVVVNGKKVIRK